MKKGDLSNCGNYRGIMLLSIPGKVFYRILLDRMKDVIDPQLRDQQAGFRKDRSCTDQIATLRIILEQSLEWNSPLFINFKQTKSSHSSIPACDESSRSTGLTPSATKNCGNVPAKSQRTKRSSNDVGDG